MHIFPTPSVQPQIWKCFLHCIPQILYAESFDKELIIRVNVSPETYPLARIHSLLTDRRQTHRALDAYSIAVAS